MITPASSLQQLDNYTLALKVVNRAPSSIFLNREFRVTKNPNERANAHTILKLSQELFKGMMGEKNVPPVEVYVKFLEFENEFKTFTRNVYQLQYARLPSIELYRFVHHSAYVVELLLIALKRKNILWMASDKGPLIDLDQLLKKEASELTIEELRHVNFLRQALFLQRKSVHCAVQSCRLIKALGDIERGLIEGGALFLSTDEAKQAIHLTHSDSYTLEELMLHLRAIRIAKSLHKGNPIQATIESFLREVRKQMKSGKCRLKCAKLFTLLIDLQWVTPLIHREENLCFTFDSIFQSIYRSYKERFVKDSPARKVFEQHLPMLRQYVAHSSIMRVKEHFLATIAKGFSRFDKSLINDATLIAEAIRKEHIDLFFSILREFLSQMRQDNDLYKQLDDFCTKVICNPAHHNRLDLVSNFKKLRINLLNDTGQNVKDEMVIKNLELKDFQDLLETTLSLLEQPEKTLTEKTSEKIDQEELEMKMREVVLAPEPGETKAPPTMPQKPNSPFCLETANLETAVWPDPTAVFRFKYYPRVTRWLAPRLDNDPLVHDPAYQKITTEAAKGWIRAQHNFALAVDGVAKSYGHRVDETLYLVGTMRIDNEVQRGLFVWGFDEKENCYHRYFTIKKISELVQEYAAKGFYELDYPRLPKLGISEKCERGEVTLYDDKSYIESESDTIITIRDPKNHAEIQVIYKY